MTPGASASGSSLLYGAPVSRINSGLLSIDERHELAGGEIKTGPPGYKARSVGEQPHCDFGPAIEFPSGRLLWMRHGALHREDGPALEGEEGFPDAWYLEGIRVAPPAPGDAPVLPEPVDVEVEALRGKHEKRRTRWLLKVPVHMEAEDFDSAKHELERLKECGYDAVIICVEEAGAEVAVDATSIRKGRVPMNAISYRVYTAVKAARPPKAG